MQGSKWFGGRETDSYYVPLNMDDLPGFLQGYIDDPRLGGMDEDLDLYRMTPKQLFQIKDKWENRPGKFGRKAKEFGEVPATIYQFLMETLRGAGLGGNPLMSGKANEMMREVDEEY